MALSVKNRDQALWEFRRTRRPSPRTYPTDGLNGSPRAPSAGKFDPAAGDRRARARRGPGADLPEDNTRRALQTQRRLRPPALRRLKHITVYDHIDFA